MVHVFGSSLRVKSFSHKLALAGVAVLAVFLVGCASTDEGPFPFSDGWRKARVERIVQGADIEKPSFWRCTRHTTAAERSKEVYALISYRDMHHRRRRMASITDALAVRPGEEVYANISRCSDSIVHADALSPRR